MADSLKSNLTRRTFLKGLESRRPRLGSPSSSARLAPSRTRSRSGNGPTHHLERAADGGGRGADEPGTGDVYFWGSLMAACLITSIPVAILSNLFLDRFISGFTVGAIK